MMIAIADLSAEKIGANRPMPVHVRRFLNRFVVLTAETIPMHAKPDAQALPWQPKANVSAVQRSPVTLSVPMGSPVTPMAASAVPVTKTRPSVARLRIVPRQRMKIAEWTANGVGAPSSVVSNVE
jgi:hypothetical protein